MQESNISTVYKLIKINTFYGKATQNKSKQKKREVQINNQHNYQFTISCHLKFLEVTPRFILKVNYIIFTSEISVYFHLRFLLQN